MTDIRIIDRLKTRLSEPLVGWEAQKRLMPEGRDKLRFPVLDELQPAAVLIALFPKENQWCFPLIQRSVDGFAHSGQIALPGGRKEGSENAIETALREAEEEVNLAQDQVEILGKISPLPIPVSQYIVQPIVGFLQEIPAFRPDPREVEKIFYVSLDELVSTTIQYETRFFQNREWEIPYFGIEGHKVWGATGMILSEFRELVTKIL